MDTVKKHKLLFLIGGAIGIVGIAAYTILTRKKIIVPPSQISDDLKKLGLTIQFLNSEQILSPEQQGTLEGLAQKYFNKYLKEEREKRQKIRCDFLKNSDKKAYNSQLLSDLKFIQDSYNIIYAQICDTLKLPIEIFYKSKQKYNENKSPQFQIAYNNQSINYEENMQESYTNDEIKSVNQKLKNLFEKYLSEIQKEGYFKENLNEIANFMTLDEIYIQENINENQVRNIKNYYKNTETSKEEVYEL